MSNQHRVINRPVHQKFCKVCQDAGKTLAEYTSHNVRETKIPTSRVTCPTLLAQECRFCFNKGHSLKYCPQIKNKETEATSRQVSAPVTKQAFKAPTNVFAMLSDGDSEEEEGEVKEEKAPMPMPIAMGLSCQTVAPSNTRRVNFKDVIATFSEVPAREPAQAQAPAWTFGTRRLIFSKLIESTSKAPVNESVKALAKALAKVELQSTPANPVVIRIKSVVMRGSWADCDSDENDEFYAQYESVYAN